MLIKANEENNYLITWLQDWFCQNCNGDWEHNENIKIYNLDNPGWGVEVNILGTGIENKPFQKLKVEITEENWYHCFIAEGKFFGAGGINNLYDILKIFKEWSQNNTSN